MSLLQGQGTNAVLSKPKSVGEGWAIPRQKVRKAPNAACNLKAKKYLQCADALRSFQVQAAEAVVGRGRTNHLPLAPSTLIGNPFSRHCAPCPLAWSLERRGAECGFKINAAR
jgi:hypothetical protein